MKKRKPTYQELEDEIKRLRDQISTMKELAKRIVAWEGALENPTDRKAPHG